MAMAMMMSLPEEETMTMIKLRFESVLVLTTRPFVLASSYHWTAQETLHSFGRDGEYCYVGGGDDDGDDCDFQVAMQQQRLMQPLLLLLLLLLLPWMHL
jgi:hypothetical protein